MTGIALRSVNRSADGGAEGSDRRAMHARLGPGQSPGDEPDQRAQTEFGGAGGMRDDADGGAVVLPGGVSRGHGGVGVFAEHDGPQPGQLFHRGAGADVLVVFDQGLGLPAGHGDGHDLVVEPALGGCHGGAVVGADRVLVLLLAGDAVLLPHRLGGLDHPAGQRVPAATGGQPAAGDRVVQHHAGTAAGAPPHGRGEERRVAHRLGATGQYDIAHPGLHLHGRDEYGLQTRPAAPVELHAADRQRQARVECGHPADRGSVHRRVAVPEHDVVDRFGRQPGPLHHLPDHHSAQLLRGDIAQRASEGADRGPDRFADNGLTHGFPPNRSDR